MKPVIPIIQIVLGVLLIIAIILQQKGSGMGATFGGSSGFYRTQRGAEKLLFYSTIVIAAAFILSSLVGLIF